MAQDLERKEGEDGGGGRGGREEEAGYMVLFLLPDPLISNDFEAVST